MKRAFISMKGFEDYIDSWHSLRAHMGHQPSSIESGRKDIRSLMRFCKEHNVVRLFGETITDYICWLKQVRGNGSGAINRKRSSLKCYIDHLRLNQVEGAVPFPIEYLPRARAPYSGPVKTLEVDEVACILNAFDMDNVIGYRDFAFFNMQYALGLRIGEVTSIDIKDIDFKKKLITIHGKGRRERLLPLIKPLIKIIKKWLAYRKYFLNSGTSPALFLSKKGNRISQRTAQEKFQEAVSKVGPLTLRKVVPHTLRHAYASHALETEKDLMVIKHVLGHASLKSTEIYLHPSMNLLRKSADGHLACDMLDGLCRKKVDRQELKESISSTAAA